MPTKTNGQLRIGELATQAGLNPKTIRYYEEIGLLPEPRRTDSSYRMYAASDIDRLRFIGKAKGIGLSLDEIREIFALRHHGERPCRHVLALVDQKLDAVDQQLRALADFREDLVAVRAEAAAAPVGEGEVCSIIEHHTTTHAAELAPGLLARLSGRSSRRR